MKTHFKNAKIVGINVDASEYLKQDVKRGAPGFVMSRSNLIEFARNPRRWLAGFNDDEETKSTEWGNLIDCLVLQPHKFEALFVVAPKTYWIETGICPKCESISDSKSCSTCKRERVEHRVEKPWNLLATQCKEWQSKQEENGQTVVKSETYESAKIATERLLSEPIIKEIVSSSDRQIMVLAQYVDAKTGIIVPVKALLDLAPSKIGEFGQHLGDLKTSLTADPSNWRRLVWQRGYDVQAAFFMDLYNVATGEQRDTWFHIVQENYPPFEHCSPLPVLSSEYLELGRTKYLSALRQYAWCLKTNEWPSFPQSGFEIGGFQIISPDAFMVGKDTEKQWIAPNETQSAEHESEMPT